MSVLLCCVAGFLTDRNVRRTLGCYQAVAAGENKVRKKTEESGNPGLFLTEPELDGKVLKILLSDGPHSLDAPMSQQLLRCLLPALLLFAGCQEGPSSGRPLGDAPDGTVEILKIGSDGKIEHVPGKFLEAVKRTDSRMVVVDCWAEWCGPCKQLGPILEEIKLAWGDQLEVVKVDVDQNQEIAAHFGADAIPDVRIFRSGTQIGEFVGLMPRAEIEAYLKSLK